MRSLAVRVLRRAAFPPLRTLSPSPLPPGPADIFSPLRDFFPRVSSPCFVPPPPSPPKRITCARPRFARFLLFPILPIPCRRAHRAHLLAARPRDGITIGVICGSCNCGGGRGGEDSSRAALVRCTLISEVSRFRGAPPPVSHPPSGRKWRDEMPGNLQVQSSRRGKPLMGEGRESGTGGGPPERAVNFQKDGSITRAAGTAARIPRVRVFRRAEPPRL